VVCKITLTPLQTRVLELAAQHLTNTQIGPIRRNLDAVTDVLKYARKTGRQDQTGGYRPRRRLAVTLYSEQKDVRNPFSAREFDILEGLFAGLMYREIADVLGISIGNVGGRIRQMKRKVRAHATEELLDEVQRLHLYEPKRRVKHFVAREVLSKL